MRTSFRLDISMPPVPPSVFIAAVGPKMLDVAGTYTAGAATWMVGLRTLAEQTVPLVRAAAERAGRPEPRILASLPIALDERRRDSSGMGRGRVRHVRPASRIQGSART